MQANNLLPEQKTQPQQLKRQIVTCWLSHDAEVCLYHVTFSIAIYNLVAFQILTYCRITVQISEIMLNHLYGLKN